MYCSNTCLLICWYPAHVNYGDAETQRLPGLGNSRLGQQVSYITYALHRDVKRMEGTRHATLDIDTIGIDLDIMYVCRKLGIQDFDCKQKQTKKKKKKTETCLSPFLQCWDLLPRTTFSSEFSPQTSGRFSH